MAAVTYAQKPDYSKSRRSVRFVSYNVGVFSKYTGDSTPEVAKMMHEIRADVVAVNEQDSCNRRHHVYQTERFAEELGDWNFAYASAMKFAGGSYGGGLVCKNPILKKFSIALPKGDGHVPRVCVVVETHKFVVASVHLDHSKEAVRVQQAQYLTQELVRLYGRSRKPVVLCGDLNASPDSQTLDFLKGEWVLVSETAPTYPSGKAKECIDYILVLKNRSRYQVHKYAVCTEFESADVRDASDHLPVFVDIVIK